jgi:hypothetical protein
VLAEAPFAWQHGHPYRLTLAATGNRLLGGVEGGPQLQWQDDEGPYIEGQIGLSNFAGCHTAYEDVHVT